MNILMILSTPIPVCEGIGSHVFGLAERLRERGHKVTIMTRGNMWEKEEFEYKGFSVIKVPFYPLYPLHVLCHGYFVRKAIDSLLQQPDLVHIHNPLVPVLSNQYPIITTFHSSVFLDSFHIEINDFRDLLIKIISKTTSFWIEKKLLKISNEIILNNYQVLTGLKTYYNDSLKYNIIPNTVDTDYYKPQSNIATECNKYLLYVGRLEYRKGLIELINAAKVVINKFPNIEYKIIGDGPIRGKLIRLAKDLGIDSRVEFIGLINDKAEVLRYYRKAHAVLIASHHDACPMVMLEAMACGKPIIATSAGYERGILEDEYNALLVRPKSPEELARATVKLLSSQELCQKLGSKARETVVEKMNSEINTKMVEDVYKNAIGKWRHQGT